MTAETKVDSLDRDFNGSPIARGDYVRLIDGVILNDPKLNYGLAVGQIVHVQHDGPRRGITVKHPPSHYHPHGATRTANTGSCLIKVDMP